MSQGTEVKQTAPQKGTSLISGRIVSTRKVSGRDGAVFITILKMPAPDEYTSPASVEVSSKNRLGQVGDDVHLKVLISGYGRSYKSRDPETGEERTVQTADNRLSVVE